MQQRRRNRLIGQHKIMRPASRYIPQVLQLPLNLPDEDVLHIKLNLPQPGPSVPAWECSLEVGVVIVAGMDERLKERAAALHFLSVFAPGIPADCVPMRA